jgi:hypothetical protein
MKTLAVKVNKRGIRYALVAKATGFAVYKLCENYASHCKGGIAYTWRSVESSMTHEAANVLFERRTA